MSDDDSDIEIRPFRDDDWDAVWPFFRAIVEAGETYAYDPAWTSDQASQVWVQQPPGVTVVAIDGDDVLGSASAGPNRPGRGSHVATASFMVDSSRRRRGVGRLLGEYVIDWARNQGYAAMQFNAVVETNTAAVALWKSLGFTIIGTVPEAFEHRTNGRVGLHVMHRFLSVD